MTIQQHASQEELEQLVRTHIRKAMKLMLVVGVLLSPFCYLRCLLNPLWVLKLKTQGIFVTALFACYVGWLYVNGNSAAGETALLWWAAWAGIMFFIHYCFYACRPIALLRQSKKYQPAGQTSSAAITSPQQYPLCWKKNAQGYQEARLCLHAPTRGLYKLAWELPGYTGEINTPDTCTPSAISLQGSPDSTTTIIEIYRLEPGDHTIGLALTNRDTEPPQEGKITQM